jgi:hypothetical protein
MDEKAESGVNDEKSIYHPSGLVFLPPAAERNFGSLRMKQCWGALLENPQFVDLEGFGRSLSELDKVWLANVYVSTGAGETELVDRFKAVRSSKTGKTYSVLTDKYEVVQDEEVVRPLFDAAQQRNLTPVGRIDGLGTGQTRGHVVFTNPEFQIRLLDDYDDNVMLGVRFYNSYTGGLSFGAEIFGVRTVCVNYCLWGDLIGRFAHKHTGDIAGLFDDYETLLGSALDSSDVLTGIVQDARDLVVDVEELEDLLWGINFGVRSIKYIVEDVAGWVPEVDKLGLNAWSLYNATTAYITYRPGGGRHVPATESLARQAVRLLTESHDRLLEEGRKRREQYEEAKRKRELEKPAVRTVA